MGRLGTEEERSHDEGVSERGRVPPARPARDHDNERRPDERRGDQQPGVDVERVREVARPLGEPARTVPLPDRELLRVDERAWIAALLPEIDLDGGGCGERRTGGNCAGDGPPGDEEERNRDQDAGRARGGRDRSEHAGEVGAPAQHERRRPSGRRERHDIRVGEQQHERARPAGKRERRAPGLSGGARRGDAEEGEGARRDHDGEGGGPVGNRARRPQDERPERKERVDRAALTVRIAMCGDAVVPAEIPGEEGPERPAVVRPAVMRIRDRPGLDAADHDSEHGGQPHGPNGADGEHGMALDRGQDALANGQPRRGLAHGRSTLRHAARIAPGRSTQAVPTVT